MAGYYARRALLGLSLVLGLTVVAYLLVYVAPGDPAYVWAGRPRGPRAAEAIELAARELGLDQPLYVQVASFVHRFLSGSWGTSIAFKRPVAEIVLRSFKATAELLLFSYLVSVPLGLSIGVFMALRRGSGIDLALKLSSSLLISVPRFWLAIIAVLALYILGLQPFGRVDPRYLVELREVTGFYLLDSLLMLRPDVFLDSLARLVPPALIVAAYPTFYIAKYVRFTLSERLYEDYVMEAVSLGVSRGTLVTRYALRGVIPAVLQLAGVNFVYSFVDAAVVEIVFMREGIGRVLVEGLLRSDYPLIVATFFVVSLVLIAVNSAVDVVQKRLDPRVRI